MTERQRERERGRERGGGGGREGGRERNIRSDRKRATFDHFVYHSLALSLFSGGHTIPTHIQECTHVENACCSMSPPCVCVCVCVCVCLCVCALVKGAYSCFVSLDQSSIAQDACPLAPY